MSEDASKTETAEAKAQGRRFWLTVGEVVALLGLGLGIAMPAATESIMGSLPRDKAGVGSAVNDTARELGGAIGVAVIGLGLSQKETAQAALTLSDKQVPVIGDIITADGLDATGAVLPKAHIGLQRPISYLSRWRLHLAARLDQSVASGAGGAGLEAISISPVAEGINDNLHHVIRIKIPISNTPEPTPFHDAKPRSTISEMMLLRKSKSANSKSMPLAPCVTASTLPRESRDLVQEHRPVKRIPLHRLEPRIADNPPQLFFRRLVPRPGRAHHVLFDHDAAHVVAAELQAHLAGLQPLRHPRRLHVQDVLQVEPRNRQRLEILDARRLFLHKPAQRRILALE